jgi:ribonuclease HI
LIPYDNEYIVFKSIKITRLDMKKIAIYTDGSSLKNPGPGGWAAAIILESGEYKVMSAASDTPETTNNRMEMMGPLKALEALPCPCDVTLYSDSQYVIKGMSQWIRGWKDRNYAGVKNSDLWRLLDIAASRHKINWVWVKGHNGNHFNEIVDVEARDAAIAMWGRQSRSKKPKPV